MRASIDVQISGRILRVPVVDTPAQTKKIAAIVSKRLDEIEAESDRIDTQAFALQAAFSFVAEAYLEQEASSDAKTDFFDALQSLSAELADILQDNEKLD